MLVHPGDKRWYGELADIHEEFVVCPVPILVLYWTERMTFDDLDYVLIAARREGEPLTNIDCGCSADWGIATGKLHVLQFYSCRDVVATDEEDFLRAIVAKPDICHKGLLRELDQLR